MPLYDYECTKCNKITEHEFSIYKDIASTLICQTCGKDTARKFTTFAAVFRGGGWGGSK